MLELDGLFKNALSARVVQLQLRRLVLAERKNKKYKEKSSGNKCRGWRRGRRQKKEHAEEVIKEKHKGREGQE